MDEAREQFQADPRLSFVHPFPATKLMFLPVKDPNQPDLLATTSDFLRIWSISEDGVALEKLLNNVSGRIRGGCWTLGSQAYHFAGGGKGLRGSGMGHWWRPS